MERASLVASIPGLARTQLNSRTFGIKARLEDNVDTVRVSPIIIALAVMGLTLPNAGGCGKTESPSPEARKSDVPAVIEFECVPPDCFAVVIVHPRQILESPKVAGTAAGRDLQKHEELRHLVEETGVDVQQLDEVTWVQLAAAPNEAPPDPLEILRFSEPMDSERIMAKLAEGYTRSEQAFAGKSYIKCTRRVEEPREWASDEPSSTKREEPSSIRTAEPSSRRTEGESTFSVEEPREWSSDEREPPVQFSEDVLCFYLADARTMVLARCEEDLRKSLAAANARAPLVERLEGVGYNHDIVGILLLEPVRGDIAESAAGALPEFATFKPLFDHVDAITLVVDVMGDPSIKLTAATASTDVAAELLPLARKAKEAARDRYAADRKKAEERWKEQKPESIDVALYDLAGQLLTGVSISQQGANLEARFHLETPELVLRLPEAWLEVRQARREASKRLEKLLGIAQEKERKREAQELADKFGAPCFQDFSRCQIGDVGLLHPGTKVGRIMNDGSMFVGWLEGGTTPALIRGVDTQGLVEDQGLDSAEIGLLEVTGTCTYLSWGGTKETVFVLEPKAQK